MTERECLDIIYSLKKCGINFLAIVSFTPNSFDHHFMSNIGVYYDDLLRDSYF
jgi:hypothetical protein